ncbi:CHAP domain-containing protein [Bifidobacterium callitrichidarum]|uniref:CHAP domain-containing protein n=2 Tax=Bifidobacterium callitrichidarum TaxID=2052941 RepID=A0A2U2NCH4_9BIFI|nr:CHAP domain-containing protein [Bifidobacterium callitrichidarum]
MAPSQLPSAVASPASDTDTKLDGTTVTGVKNVKFDSKTALTSNQLIASNTRSNAASRGDDRGTLQSEQETGSWDLGEALSITTGNGQKIDASNPVIKVLVNSRDSGSVPAGFNPNHATGDNGNAYPYGQCTWWAYKRRAELGMPVGSNLGNGSQWAASAQSLGYWVDQTPRQGDVAVYGAGQQGADAVYGHVAVVEAVNDDGSIVISESNVNGQIGPFQRTVSADNAKALQYIHY